jgi:hypothetical protein
MRRATPLAWLLVAGCAAVEPEIAGPFPADAAAARERLVAARAAGEVRLEVRDAPPTLPPARVAALAATGISALSVTFAVDGGPPQPRLVLQFGEADPYELCTGPPAVEPGPPPLRLAAAFCDGETTLAALAATAAGPDQGAVDRLVWRTTDRLFPDDYESRYGLHLFGERMRFGLDGSYGF